MGSRTDVPKSWGGGGGRGGGRKVCVCRGGGGGVVRLFLKVRRNADEKPVPNKPCSFCGR